MFSSPAQAGGCTFTALPFRAGIALVLFCAGCAPHPAAPAVEVRNPKMMLAVEMTPRPPTSLDPTAFQVRITDAARRSVTGASVVLRLEMPSMTMGDNNVPAHETTAGTYETTGRFTMAGAWRVTVTASKGTERAMQAFPWK